MFSSDGLQIAIHPDTKTLVIQRWKDSTGYTWTQVNVRFGIVQILNLTSIQLPYDPTTAFHTYSLVKNKPANPSSAAYSLYQDSSLLATYTTVVPAAPGSIQMTYYVDTLPSTYLTSVQVKSITYSPGKDFRNFREQMFIFF